MDCFLSWDLKGMMNISAEKLQKNISQQKSFMDMYRADLIAESLKFNAAALLKYTLVNRTSLGTGDLERKATDSLAVMLHATTFLKRAYFAPTDAENGNVAKCVKNLHRIMMENVKATMKFIDYGILLRTAGGELSESDMHEARRKAYDDVFPCDDMPNVCDDGDINDQFFKLIDQENGKGSSIVDFDAARTTTLNQDILQRLAGQTRRDEDLPESEYGIIKACKAYLDTPFVKYGNSYFSFVTAYSLRNIAQRISDLVPEKGETSQEADPTEPMADPAEAPAEPNRLLEAETVSETHVRENEKGSGREEPQVMSEEAFGDEVPFDEPESESGFDPTSERESELEPEPETESVFGPTSEQESEPEPESEPIPQPISVHLPISEQIPMDEPEIGEESEAQGDGYRLDEDDGDVADGSEDGSDVEEELFDDDDDFEDTIDDESPEDGDSERIETDELEYPDEFDEDSSNSQETVEGYDGLTEVYEDTDYDSDNDIQSDRIHEEYYDEEPYTALVSPDAYRYLDDAKPSDFIRNPVIEEDKEYEDEDFVTQDEEIAAADQDDDMYSSPSLFSIADESDEDEQKEEKDDYLEDLPSNHQSCYPEDEEEPHPEPDADDESDAGDLHDAVDDPDMAEEPIHIPEPVVETEPAVETGTETGTEPILETEPEPAVEPESPETTQQEREFEEIPSSEPEADVDGIPLLNRILKASPSKSNPIFQYLTGIDKSQQREIVRFIELARKNWLIDGKDKLFTIPETSISVAVFTDNHDPMLADQRRQNIGAVMYASRRDGWNSLEISYDEKGEVSRIEFNRISRGSFHDWEWRIVERMGNQIMERRGK